jgi:hypothetical protein
LRQALYKRFGSGYEEAFEESLMILKPKPTDNELDGAFEVIETLMEPCEKCGKIARGGRWYLPNEQPEDGMPICSECYEDKEGFQEWFLACIKDVLDNSGEYEKLPNGKYRPKESELKFY